MAGSKITPENWNTECKGPKAAQNMAAVGSKFLQDCNDANPNAKKAVREGIDQAVKINAADAAAKLEEQKRLAEAQSIKGQVKSGLQTLKDAPANGAKVITNVRNDIAASQERAMNKVIENGSLTGSQRSGTPSFGAQAMERTIEGTTSPSARKVPLRGGPS